MNREGIFCFLLVLAFIALEIRFLNEATNASQRLQKAKALAFEAEKASFVRALMENSVDVAIEESLLQGLLLNLEPDQIKKQANNRLAALFRLMQREYQSKLVVSFDSKSLDPEFLNQNSSVLVTRLGKKTVEGLYHFTGGIMKNEAVSAEIAGSRVRQYFKIPAGYTVKAIG